MLVNVVGFTVEEYAEVVGGLDGVAGIAAFELNLSCPNTSAGGIEFGADPECVRRIVAGCRARTRLPLSAKLSPVLPDIAGMAVVARDAGADAISVVNTLPGLLFAESGAAPRLGNGNGGVSGPVLLPIGVLAAARVVERTGGDAGDRGRRGPLRGRCPAVPPRGRVTGGDRHRGAGRSPAARADHSRAGAWRWLR